MAISPTLREQDTAPEQHYYPPIAELIPHVEPMVLLDKMCDWSPGTAICQVQIRDGARFVANGQLQTLCLLEHMAQAVAACLGYEAYRGGEGVRTGMIIACRDFRVHVPNLRVGDDVVLKVKRIRGNEQLSHFECEAACGTAPVAAAVMTLFHSDGMPRK